MMKTFSMGSFVGGFMLGAVCIAAWFVSNDTVPTPLLSLSPNTIAPTAQKTTPESGAVSVNDQPAGAEVVVESVTVPPPGVWVTVREFSGDELGNILGAARVIGPRNGVSVSLLRETVPGTSYAIELYRDDGDGVFDLSSDSVYVDFATGAPVIAHFTTTN